MIDAKIEAEYNAAKDEYEKAESVFLAARTRLSNAGRAMKLEWDRHWKDAEDRVAAAREKIR